MKEQIKHELRIAIFALQQRELDLEGWLQEPWHKNKDNMLERLKAVRIAIAHIKDLRVKI